MRCTGAHVAADGRPAKAPTAQKVRFFLVGNGDRCVAHGRSDGRPKAHSPPEARCWQVLTRTNVINEGLPKGGHSGKFWVERRVYLARVSTAPREPHTAPRPSRWNVVHSPHRRARTALQLVIRCLCPLVIRRLQHGILIKNPFLPFRDRGSFLLALNCGRSLQLRRRVPRNRRPQRSRRCHMSKYAHELVDNGQDGRLVRALHMMRLRCVVATPKTKHRLAHAHTYTAAPCTLMRSVEQQIT